MRSAIDAFTGGALVVERVIERTLPIEQRAHQPAFLPVEVFHAAFPFGELRVVTGLACALRKEQGTTNTLGAIAIGVLKLEGASELPYLGCYATLLIKDMVY